MFDKNIFCERLKQARIEKNLTQSDVGAAFDVPKQYISRWEKGIQEPNLSTLYSLSKVLEVSIDYLVGRTDNPNVNK